MFHRVLITASTAILLLASPMPAPLPLATTTPAHAGSLEFLHDKVRIGGHVCMKDHTHTGKGGDALQGLAMAKAARDWSEFTALEYGAAWGNFGIAADKNMLCGPLREAWMCEVIATPCRL